MADDLTDPMRGSLGPHLAVSVTAYAGGVRVGSGASSFAVTDDLLGVVATWLTQRARWYEKQPTRTARARYGRKVLVRSLQLAAAEIEREREELSRG